MGSGSKKSGALGILIVAAREMNGGGLKLIHWTDKSKDLMPRSPGFAQKGGAMSHPNTAKGVSRRRCASRLQGTGRIDGLEDRGLPEVTRGNTWQRQTRACHVYVVALSHCMQYRLLSWIRVENNPDKC